MRALVEHSDVGIKELPAEREWVESHTFPVIAVLACPMARPDQNGQRQSKEICDAQTADWMASQEFPYRAITMGPHGPKEESNTASRNASQRRWRMGSNCTANAACSGALAGGTRLLSQTSSVR
jgi:hypothetical protein